MPYDERIPVTYTLMTRKEILREKILIWELRREAGHPDAERALADLRRKLRTV